METEAFSEKAKKGPNKIVLGNLGFRESLLESSKVSFFEGFGPKSPKKPTHGFLKVVIYIYIYIYIYIAQLLRPACVSGSAWP